MKNSTRLRSQHEIDRAAPCYLTALVSFYTFSLAVEIASLG
ncbi:hypothetical protein [Chroococcidiopsis thermalis]|nr:hypothetical protein [Chroococcidiopsis thermalis]